MGADPASLALIASAVSAGGNVYQGLQQKAYLKGQARQQEYAAAREKLQAVRELRARMAAQNVAFAARGVSPLTGSASTLRKLTYRYGHASLTSTYLARMQSARAMRAQGRAALIGGILKGAASVAGGYAAYGSSQAAAQVPTAGLSRNPYEVHRSILTK